MSRMNPSDPSAPRNAPPPSPGPPRGHVVQFYERPETILDAAFEFLGNGMREGDGGLIIATPAKRAALEDRLTASGIDLEDARLQGRFVSLDASATLDQFAPDCTPDPRRFADVVGSAVSAASSKARSGRVRAFGEMVALLCERGRPEAAIRLEGLWNDLGKTHSFSLLCGYPLDFFRGERLGRAFSEICESHLDVVPAESFGALTTSRERGLRIASLQQRAASMEVEADHRRKAEKTVRTREQELSDFLENAAEGIHKVGPDGRILWANKAELDLLGYTADEYVGHSITEFHADFDVISEILARLTRGETLRDQPARLRCKDGSIKHVLIHSNVYREDGEFVHTRCFSRDVTDRVNLEEQLRAKIEELAQTDRRKDEFLAMLGHELRNPLSPIVTAVELARRRPEDGHLVARSIEVIDRQTRHMTRLVDDLLDVSRITRGTISLRRQTVSLTTVIEQALEQARPLIEERGHQLALKLPSTPLLLNADPDRLEQILTNLLSNAAKYTEIGGRISIDVRREDPNVVISVSDDGVGLAPEHRDQIFDLFVRSSDSNVSAASGLGVGLTVVRRLAEMHGGSVEARSEGPRRGSEFVVRLPVLASPPGQTSSRAAEQASPLPSPGRRILVADDNADAADGLTNFLRELGHSVRTVYDGNSAIEEARRTRPEIVLLDIGMPGADGHEVARRLREEVALKSSLLVALSGYCQESDRQRSREAGFDHHLAKPVDLSRLEGLLKLPS